VGVGIIADERERAAALYCSTSGFAFGPLFRSREQAQKFLDWQRARGGVDVRLLDDAVLMKQVIEFRLEYPEYEEE
jgi:hypothetical protein